MPIESQKIQHKRDPYPVQVLARQDSKTQSPSLSLISISQESMNLSAWLFLERDCSSSLFLLGYRCCWSIHSRQTAHGILSFQWFVVDFLSCYTHHTVISKENMKRSKNKEGLTSWSLEALDCSDRTCSAGSLVVQPCVSPILWSTIVRKRDIWRQSQMCSKMSEQ